MGERCYLQQEVADLLNMSRYTLADLEKRGKIHPAKRMENGYRYYFKEDIVEIAKVYYKEGWERVINPDSLEN